jgi:uncharacterized membrane-anchored protein YitT (DUF2179 family)
MPETPAVAVPPPPAPPSPASSHPPFRPTREAPTPQQPPQPPPSIADTTQAPPHGPIEDIFALFAGTVLVAIGLGFLKAAHLATGGTAGLSFLIHYLSGWPLGAVLFAVNLPFYVFAWRAMGPTFTLRTALAVTLLSLETAVMPALVAIEHPDPAFAAIVGGVLAGTGLLALIRHKASLGGVGVLAYYLQDRHGWSAGRVQMGFDALITAAAFVVLPPSGVAYSILGALALNLVLALNHRPGRYMGV